MFADDTQAYLQCPSAGTLQTTWAHAFAAVSEALRSSMQSNDLLLNHAKTQHILFGTLHQLSPQSLASPNHFPSPLFLSLVPHVGVLVAKQGFKS